MSERTHERTREEVIALLQQVDLFEGLPGDASYIVFRGAVEISQARADGTEEKLAVRRKGDGFGEMALLNGALRSATATATEETQLVSVAHDDFQQLLGGDSRALRMMRSLSKALRALSVRFANTDRSANTETVWVTLDETPATDEFAVSRAMQAGLLPHDALKVRGYDIAAGTTTEKGGRGSSVWDWLELEDGRTALVSVSVTTDGFPPAPHLGKSRARRTCSRSSTASLRARLWPRSTRRSARHRVMN